MINRKSSVCLVIFSMLFMQCGIFEPPENKGSIAVVLVPEKQEQGLSKAFEALNSVGYILKKGSSKVKEDNLARNGSYFEGTISDLDPGNDYSVQVIGLVSRQVNKIG
jgi:hypothetical protein